MRSGYGHQTESGGDAFCGSVSADGQVTIGSTLREPAVDARDDAVESVACVSRTRDDLISSPIGRGAVVVAVVDEFGPELVEGDADLEQFSLQVGQGLVSPQPGGAGMQVARALPDWHPTHATLDDAPATLHRPRRYNRQFQRVCYTSAPIGIRRGPASKPSTNANALTGNATAKPSSLSPDAA